MNIRKTGNWSENLNQYLRREKRTRVERVLKKPIGIEILDRKLNGIRSAIKTEIS
jgi:hypothetical protein